MKRFRVAAFLGVALVSFGLALVADELLGPVELDTMDTRFSLRGTEKAPSDLVVVAIDNASFRELGAWPFPRSIHADVIDRIAPDRPKVIAYDVQFSEPSEPTKQKEDLALAEAILNADRKVVLASTEFNQRGESKFLGGPGDVLDEINGQVGHGLLPTDPGGVFRRLDHSVDELPALSVVAAQIATGRKVDPDSLGGDSAWIDYHGPPGTIARVSFARVAQGKIARGFFRDKVVVIGPLARSLQDIHPTPASDQQMSGVEIQANAISTVTRGFPLKSSSEALKVALIALLGLAVPLAAIRLPLLGTLAVALAVGVVFAVGVQLAFNAGDVLPVAAPFAALALSSVGALTLRGHYSLLDQEKRRTRDVFARFVPEQVVDEALALSRRERELLLGGVSRECTVMFCDLRGFTSFAEDLPPDRVIEVLNRYLTAMSEAILDHGGTLVSYQGDGIMAVFGAPIQQDDHADRGLAAASEMVGPRLQGFNEWLRAEALGEGFRMGLGLNSGPVMSGNVGSEQRLEYTAIGDTTNTAARLEGMTKDSPHQLFLADSTREFLKQPPDDLVYVDELEVRGRQARIKVWSLADAV